MCVNGCDCHTVLFLADKLCYFNVRGVKSEWHAFNLQAISVQKCTCAKYILTSLFWSALRMGYSTSDEHQHARGHDYVDDFVDDFG